jgi:hypothetical protein
MTFYQELAVINPYLQSIRKLKNYLSVDVNFPNTWKLPKKYVPENSVIENETSIKDFRSFSFVSVFEEKLVEEMLINLNGVIKFNKEREEKEKLFETKVTELKQIFDKQNLENLKNLSFELTEKKLELDNEFTESE